MKINQHKQIIFNSLKNYAPDIYAYALKKSIFLSIANLTIALDLNNST